MNAPATAAGLLLLATSILGETIARDAGFYGVALVLEILVIPAILVLALGLIGTTEPPDRGETSSALPEDATAPEF